MKAIVWKNVEQKYGSPSKHCYVGPICVGVVAFNAFKLKNDFGVDYSYKVLLPGVKGSSGAVATENDAIQTVQNAVQDWFKKTCNNS